MEKENKTVYSKIKLTPAQIEAILREWKKNHLAPVLIDELNRPDPITSGPQFMPILGCRKGYDCGEEPL